MPGTKHWEIDDEEHGDRRDPGPALIQAAPFIGGLLLLLLLRRRK